MAVPRAISGQSVSMIDKLFEGNKRFIEKDFLPHHDEHEKLSKGQSPTVLWIGCSDSRVNPERITCSRPGTIFVHRNIGNVVPNNDWNFATVLEYAINHLKVKDIVICGHADCGAMKALGKPTTDAYIPLWLNNARRAKQAVDERMGANADPIAKKKALELENIKLQMEHLRNYPLVTAAEREGRITLHGIYYDLENGAIQKII